MLTAIALSALSAVLVGFGIWMIAVQGKASGLIAIAFGLFNVGVAIFSFQRKSQ